MMQTHPDHDDPVVECDKCQQCFSSRDLLVDHLEDAHGLISQTVRDHSSTVE